MMLFIETTTEHKPQVEQIIGSVERLHELVTISTDEQHEPATGQILQVGATIHTPPDWHDAEPPYLFPDVELSAANLLSLTFYRLGNLPRALQEAVHTSDLEQHLQIAVSLQQGTTLDAQQIAFLQQTSTYNLALAYHYGIIAPINGHRATDVAALYEQALTAADTAAEKLLVVKQLATWLLDTGQGAVAVNLLRDYLPQAGEARQQNALTHLLSVALLATLQKPFDDKQLAEIEQLQQSCIAYYDKLGLKLNSALLLMDAAEVAGYRKDFIAASKHIDQAIQFLKEEEIPELLGEALLRKATLLYTWSKNGMPQYFKPAINAYQHALKIFKKDSHPEQYGHIQHNLALLYSEIPVAEQERAIWAAFSAAAFQEALKVYNKSLYPYQYAMVCHNYATALMGFPEARLSSNIEKADGLFEEALKIRTAQAYPLERALTLLNQLELFWLAHNPDRQAEKQRFDLMVAKAQEVKQLTDDKTLLERANEQLQKLSGLQNMVN